MQKNFAQIRVHKRRSIVESAKNYSLKFEISLPLQLVLETADLLYDLFWVPIALVSNSDSSLTQSWSVLFSNIPFFVSISCSEFDIGQASV